MGLSYSYAIVTSLVLTLLWSFIATGLLISSYQNNSQQTQKTQDLLVTIFNYQTRYDRVYERTYPEHSQINIASQTKPVVNSNNPIQEVNENSEKEVEKLTLSAKPLEKPKREAASALPENKIEKSTNTVDPIKVDRYKITQVDDQLILEFSIKNQTRPSKASGYVIGFAKYISINGETYNVSSPPGVLTTKSINRWSLPRNNRFSIRYYTSKKLVFKVPNRKGGSFESIKIHIGGVQDKPIEYIYNIKGSEGVFAPVIDTP